MTNAQPRTLVIKDQAGEYYLLPQATVEQGRVPEEHKAEIERLVAEAGAQDDVSGHAIMIGGEWWSEPGTEQRHPIPPTRVGGYGPSLNPPRLPRQPRVD